MATLTMGEEAVALARRGFRVHPLWPIVDGGCGCGNPNCAAIGKHPRWHDWPKKATDQPSLVDLHWQAHPSDGIGIATGGGWLVVDLDGPDGQATWTNLGLGRPTLAASTGNGTHLYYRVAGDLPNSARRLGPGVDTRGAGGYVVAPPSPHRSGKHYAWIDEREPVALPLAIQEKLAEREWTPTELDWEASDGITGWPFGGVIAGERNVTMTRYVGALYAAGLNDDEVYTLALEANRTYFSPPLLAGEVSTICRSISRAEGRKQDMLDDDPLDKKPLLQRDNDNPAVQPSGKFKLVQASTVKVSKIDWVWPGYLGRKLITNLAGDGGVGKSVLTVDIAARLSRGAGWPDGSTCGPSNVVLLNAEDDPSTVLVPRLVAAGADLARVHIGPDLMRFPADLEELGALCQAVDASLLVIDPVMAFLDSRIDPNDQAKVTMLLTKITQLAIKCDLAVVIVQHLNKRGDGSALYRTSGSTAWLSRARVGLQCVKDKNEKGRVLLTHVKGNYAKEQATWAYSKVDRGDGVVLDWDSEPVDLDADDALSAPSNDERTARTWLASELARGPVAVRDVEQRARDAGISALDLTKARLSLRVEKLTPSGQAPMLALAGNPQMKISRDAEIRPQSSDLVEEDEWA